MIFTLSVMVALEWKVSDPFTDWPAGGEKKGRSVRGHWRRESGMGCAACRAHWCSGADSQGEQWKLRERTGRETERARRRKQWGSGMERGRG
jgi:hypothetical protein